MIPADRIATRTYLEMKSPSALRPSRLARTDLRVERDESDDPSLWRMLYTEVGRQYHWVDRLPWTDEEATAYLSDPAISFWVLYADGRIAGYFELKQYEDAAVEIAYFGLLPEYTGRGLGGHLLTEAVERAWSLGASRVWLHTCSLDHPSAIPNYLRRGFTVFKTEQYPVTGL
jgi:GNAT superfamily N-acetyltransferase